ncbi:fimbrial protein [Providencia vermicola]|uniref:Fimbrial protein n=1 Tax=Providencia vermicola TaxID=333965 RepID=A0AAX3RYQ6_9GAMM|nr:MULTISPECIES: fimbrial protein [Providencia]ELR5122956.1 type 1 fimbrial protein [Providencia stuartii]ELR5144214.1 type 1 fimbrial protein [Providencia stuartii]ELX8379870.1 type 1 fimbrial protein [Providencia stuartii]ELZ5941073.1 type 1 fimbrial protein [Providencia stuartii]EMD5259260.1 type 1 fimbrial protein [Providencia stuartii]
MLKKWLAYTCIIFMSSWSAFSLANDLKVKGTLVNAPCTIAPEDKNVEINFGDIRLLDIYERGFEFSKKELILVISECDLSIAQKLKVKFIGTPHHQLAGFLSLDGSDTNPGLGIGFETVDGKPVLLNENTDLILIEKNGRNELKFNTFLKASQDAINNKSIKPGRFSAAATFLIQYE